ncbi:MAG: hypothetical protein V1754_13685 [Pseudomonadota bacterium]
MQTQNTLKKVICVPLCLFVSTFFALGCGGSGGDADDFIKNYPVAYCNMVFRCCDSSERSYSSKTVCENLVGGEVSNLLAFVEAPTPHAMFLSSQADLCINRLENSDCTDPLLATGCLNTVTRALNKKGDECVFSAECGDFVCIQAQVGATGYCGETAIVGGKCSGDDRGCPENAYCSNTRVCTDKKESSEICTSPNECLSGICSPSIKICAGKLDPFCDGQ